MFLKMLASITAAMCLTATVTFAAPEQVKKPPVEQKKCTDFEKDPIRALECKKERIQSLLKEGKITKEEADEVTAKIDEKIAHLKEFNKLTLEQKRVRLIQEFKAAANNRVNEGKLTREEADKIIKEFNETVSKWDGTGFPKLHGNWMKDGKPQLHPKDMPKAQ